MSHHFIDLEIEHETLVLLNEKIAHRNNIECVQCNFLLSVSFLRMLAMSVKIYFEYALSKKRMLIIYSYQLYILLTFAGDT